MNIVQIGALPRTPDTSLAALEKYPREGRPNENITLRAGLLGQSR
jgi:hypothetical protein